jgi:hypothetical protein
LARFGLGNLNGVAGTEFREFEARVEPFQFLFVDAVAFKKGR